MLSHPLLDDAPARASPSVAAQQRRPWLLIIACVLFGTIGPLHQLFSGVHDVFPELLTGAINAVALAALSIALASAIDRLASIVGDHRGSVLAASLANVVELVFSLLALKQGMLRFVQVTLLGTVLTNCLVAPGVC